jgi:ABC-type molybdate transport system substrate-binding protein
VDGPKIDPVTIGPDFDLAKLARDGRVATGDVREVPVGLYAYCVRKKDTRVKLLSNKLVLIAAKDA